MSGSLKRIHINQHVIKYNKKHNTKFPCCTVKEGNNNRYAREVIIQGPSKVIYKPDCPLKCGAHVWIETNSDVELIDECKYSDLKDMMNGNT